MTRSTLALLAAVASLLPVSLSHAQNATTTPVGAMTLSFEPDSKTAFTLPLLRESVYSGNIVSNTTNSITAALGTDFSTIVSADQPFFVEITTPGHPYEGHRFDVNNSATISSANNVISLDLSTDSHSTMPELPDLTGAALVLRPHWTLAGVFGTGNSTQTLQSGTSPDGADQILVWDGNGYVSFWFRRNTAGTVFQWRSIKTGTLSRDNAALPPGKGFFLYRKSPTEGFEVTLTGEVRTNATIQKIDSGLNFVSSGYPVDLSPLEAGYTENLGGFMAGTSPSNSDYVLVWTGSFFTRYWYRSNTAGTFKEWRSISTGTTGHDATKFMGGDAGYFVYSASPKVHLIERPFNLN